MALADEMARAMISKTKPGGSDEWQSRCVLCQYHWWDSEPERHWDRCAVGRYRAASLTPPEEAVMPNSP